MDIKNGNQHDTMLKFIKSHFLNASEQNKLKILDTILSASGPSELFYLNQKISQITKRDFLMLLPAEICEKILLNLDIFSLMRCLCVSKTWYTFILHNESLWKNLYLTNCKNNPTSSNTNELTFFDMFRNLQLRHHSLSEEDSFDKLFLEGHNERITALYYYNGKIGSGSDDHSVRIWDCNTGRCLHVLKTHTISDLKFDEKEVITASFDQTAVRWCLHSGESKQKYIGHVAAVFCVELDRILDILVTSSADTTIKIWSLSTGTILNSMNKTHASWVSEIVLIRNEPDSVSAYNLVARDDTDIVVWHLSSSHSILSKVSHQEPPLLLAGAQLVKDKLYIPQINPSHFTINQYTCTNVMNKIDSVSRYKLGLDDYKPQLLLGIGLEYAAYVSKYFDDVVLQIRQLDNVMSGYNVLLPRSSYITKRGKTCVLGETDWVDGFNGINDTGFFCSFALTDHRLCLYNWKRLKTVSSPL